MHDSVSRPTGLAAVLHGRRGRFLMALLLTEFAGAMQGIAYSTVLPVMARDLDGRTPVGALQLVFVVLAGVALAATVLAAARRSRRASDDPA